ncbi:hypothetical protein BG000_008554 [Podila horticola]|nr:hypothetical protein BG000_008554 [Podila horticola]
MSESDAYLFEFKSSPRAIEAADERRQFEAAISGMTSVTVRHSFTVLLNGVSAQVLDPLELSLLMALDIILTVTPLTIVSPPEQVASTVNALVLSAQNMTGVTRVQQELGLTGKGIKVGIIDTGIDYLHPALGGGFGPGFKVEVGWDFVGDLYNGQNTPVPSSNPMDCAGHGSHVAGIVAADDSIVQGVAPQVTLGAYRVLGCNGSSNDDVILAALERAVEDEMDVINLSIGEPNGWPMNPMARAIGGVTKRGIMVAVSQGNENTQGLFSVNYIADSASVLSVASFINTKVLLSYFTTPLEPDRRIWSLSATIDPVKIDFGVMSQPEGLAFFEKLKAQGSGSTDVTKEVIASFGDGPAPFLNPAGGSTSLFSSYGLDNELHIKPDLGAPGENIYSTWPRRNGSYTTLSGTSMASPHVAGALALALQHRRAITGSIAPLTWEQIQNIYNIFKITSAPTSVYKDHQEFDVLQEATTFSPGNETASWRTINGGGSVTSIAKQGAGMIDVYRAVLTMESSLKPSAVSSTTQTIVLPPSIELNDTEFATVNPYRVTIYNNGPEAVVYELRHIPAEALHEPSIEPKEIKMQELAAGTYNVSKSGKDKDDVIFLHAPAGVSMLSSITVPAKGQRDVAVKFAAPSAVPDGQHWIYSGYISITPVYRNSPQKESVYVSYAGVTGRMRDLTIFLRPTEQELAETKEKSLCQVLGSGVANKTDFVYSMVDKDVPIISFCVQNPTQFLLLDVIGPGTDETNYEVIGRVGANEFVARSVAESIVTAVQWNGTIESSNGDGSMPNGNPSERIPSPEVIRRQPGMDLIYGMRAVPNGHHAPYESDQTRTTKLAERGMEAPTKSGDKAPGTPRMGLPSTAAKENVAHALVPNGSYRFRLMALRFMGSYEKKEDYDIWISPTFVIDRKG